MTYCGSNIFLKDYSSYFFEVVHRTKLKYSSRKNFETRK